MSTVKQHKDKKSANAIKQNALQKVIIVTVDPTLNAKENTPVPPKAEELRKAFTNYLL